MNNTTDCLQKVFKEDGEGATYSVAQSVFEGQMVDYPFGYPDMGRTLIEMKSFMPNENDVLLITHPRSGMFIGTLIKRYAFFMYLTIKFL